MSGFTLGAPQGATLGGADGGQLGTATPAYRLGADALPRLVEEVATHRTLELTFRLPTAMLVDRARTAKTDENQIDVRPLDTGGFTAVDRAGGSNTFTLRPPQRRQPLRQEGTYHVARYEESLVSAELDEWDLTIEFVRDGHRTDTRSLGQSRASDEWSFGTRYGTVATSRVDAEFLGTGAAGVERFEVIARPTFDQAHVLEAALSRLDGVRIRQLAEATNRAVDETGDSGNTVDVTSPDSDDVVTDGDYVVLGWESRRLNDAYQEMSLEMAKAP